MLADLYWGRMSSMLVGDRHLGRTRMLKTLALILAASSVVGLVLPAKAATGTRLASGALVSDQLIVPVQQRGPGSGSGRGTGPGTGQGGCPERCRTVVVPGSGRGPQEVCERPEPQCETIIEPGSGKGPQRVCRCP
jgi:hypothetical protein